ncbi:Uncharacterised protein [Vibrio cholerae]|nr:Uncharacterised protein [Vibrio cholerae]CSI71990.1 Uncharacterised protein [Vibrio cholerae]
MWIIDRRSNPTTPIVAAHNDVFDLQHIDRILNDRKTVEIGMDNLIGNVTVDK